jgi:hypothetical protein
MRGLARSVLPPLCLVVAGGLLPLANQCSGMQVQVVRGVAMQAEPATADPLDIDEEEDEVAVQPMQRVFVMNDDQFDLWVFGAPRNSQAGRNKLDSQLMLQVDDVSRVCSLSEPQKRKLQLAGRGDIKRFFEKVEEKRKKFDKVKTDQNKVSEIYQELVPLQAVLHSGLFNQGSFYSKTLKTVVSDEAYQKYQELVRQKNLFRYRAKVELVVAQIDQSVGFRGQQRRKLTELILSETQPPERYGQYDYYVVLYQASKVPASKLKPFFDDGQWARLQRSLNQGRGMEQFLRRQGLLPAREDVGNAGLVKAIRQPASQHRDLPGDVFAPAPDIVK